VVLSLGNQHTGMNAAGFLGVFLRLFRKFVFVRDDLDVTSDLGLKWKSHLRSHLNIPRENNLTAEIAADNNMFNYINLY